MFDLMKDKPHLDIPTLNWLWDSLWRCNAANRPANAAQRAVRGERERVLKMLEAEAQAQTAADLAEDAVEDAEEAALGLEVAGLRAACHAAAGPLRAYSNSGRMDPAHANVGGYCAALAAIWAALGEDDSDIPAVIADLKQAEKAALGENCGSPQPAADADLRAENKRLREACEAAMRLGAGVSGEELRDIARAALARKAGGA